MATMQKLSIFLAALCLASPSMACQPKTRSTLPQVIIPTDCLAPPWPETNVRFGEPPSVEQAFFIDAQGKVLKTRILKSSGSREFDDAARVALAQCRYSPPPRPGTPRPGWVKVHYQWVVE
jgi:protein TonB